MEYQQHREIMLQRKYRALTYSHKWVPELRISGLWLYQCGFHAGDKVDVAIVNGELRIKLKGQ
ncbi:hypothetical protein HDF26_003444 [Pedobacter cryoconitis]|uniref:SymE family type I addiction module toxin n=1 Tax=Pedobacter cryoconitis TaxID=188932 RepID=UPI0017A98D28|nr:hypothetical protein [Pedobacter cryoconitis]